METITLNAFDKGMTGDPRDTTIGVFRVLKHFNTELRKRKLTPHFDMVLDAVTESTLNDNRITRMVAASGKFWGFGQVSAADSHAQVYIKASGSTPTDVWTSAINGHDPSSNGGARNDALFDAYHDYLYGGNNTGIWKYGPLSGSPAFTYNENTTIIPTGQGLIHSQDDIYYVPCTNGGTPYIALNNAGTWNNTALQLPSGATNVSLFEQGNYLGIALNLANGASTVYLWDRDTSQTTISESINWGTGTLIVCEDLGGVIVGVSVLAGTETALTPRVAIKYYTGSEVVSLMEFECSLATIYAWKQKFDNLVYFLAELTIDGTAHRGLWKLVKNGTAIAVSFDRLPRNDTDLNSGSLKGFYRWGDYVFISYLNPADGNYTLWRTDDQMNYSATSILESTINPNMPAKDLMNNKQLMAVALSYEGLPTGAQATLKYRVDGGSWTDIFTETNAGQISTEQTMDATGTEFTAGTEYEFRVESIGGGEITGLKYKYAVLPTLI